MKLFNENFSKSLIYIGIMVFVVTSILFLWGQDLFVFNSEIRSDKFASFGDFIGGMVGSLWALAGVVLFYLALQDQRSDIRTNREILQVEVKTLEQQVNEFKLQTSELELTRSVFKEQSITLKKQQFESTFFNSLELISNIINDLEYSDNIKGRRSFKSLYKNFSDEYHRLERKSITDLSLNLIEKLDYLDIIQRSYSNFYSVDQEKVGHYFRTLYNIVRFVDSQNLDDPSYYIRLIRAQLSSYEHILLFYNGLSTKGVKFKNYIEKYALLDNVAKTLLLDPLHEALYDVKAFSNKKMETVAINS